MGEIKKWLHFVSKGKIMLGKFVKVRVTSPMYSYNKRFGFRYALNYGLVEGGAMPKNTVRGAYIMGINHPVRSFDGRVIAVVRRKNGKGVVWVVAPKSTRFINNEVKEAIRFAENEDDYQLECFYESSCGAVVFCEPAQHDTRKFLLIRNRRSAHWGFPKGHVERGETYRETAIREVLEETGVSITILPGFEKRSDYTIQGRIEKSVTIFLAKTDCPNLKMQEEEIEDCNWFTFDDAMRQLNYENDKRILAQAGQFLSQAVAD